MKYQFTKAVLVALMVASLSMSQTLVYAADAAKETPKAAETTAAPAADKKTKDCENLTDAKEKEECKKGAGEGTSAGSGAGAAGAGGLGAMGAVGLAAVALGAVALAASSSNEGAIGGGGGSHPCTTCPSPGTGTGGTGTGTSGTGTSGTGTGR